MSEKRPEELPRFADEAAAGYPGAVEPTELLKNRGYPNGYRPPAGYFNWFQQHHARWLRFLEANLYLPQLDIATSVVVSGTTTMLDDVCYGPGAGASKTGMFAAVGKNSSTQGLLCRSLYGDEWTSTVLTGMIARGIAHGGAGDFGDRKLIFVGYVSASVLEGRIRTVPANSLTGTDFTNPSPDTSPAPGFLTDVVWNGNIWCAVGVSTTESPVLQRGTDDGETWESLTPVAFGGGLTGGFSRVLALGTRILALGTDSGGSGRAQYSDDDGETWTQATVEPGLVGISSACWCWDEGEGEPSPVVLVTTLNGQLWRSEDAGETWSVAQIEVGARYDGEQSRAPAFYYASGLCHSNGVTTCIARDEDTSQDWLLASFDLGVSWRAALRLPDRYKWPASATDGNRNVLVGGTDAENTYVILPTSRGPMRLPKP